MRSSSWIVLGGGVVSMALGGLIALRLLFGWSGDDLLLVVFATILLASGLAVVALPDIIRCGLALIVCFGALAGIYVILGAPLVAAAQVLVYIGAIAVLVLFAIMLTQTKAAPARLVFQTQAFPAAVAATLFGLIVAITVIAADWETFTVRVHTATEALAEVLFADYLLPFEVVGVLLLAAVVGGVFLAKREEGGRP